MCIHFMCSGAMRLHRPPCGLYGSRLGDDSDGGPPLYCIRCKLCLNSDELAPAVATSERHVLNKVARLRLRGAERGKLADPVPGPSLPGHTVAVAVARE